VESDFKRYTGRAKLDITPVKWFRTGLNTSMAYSNQNYPYQGSGGGSDVLTFARRIGPIYTVYLRDRTTGDFILDANGDKIYDFGNNSPVLGVLRPAAETRLFTPGQNPAATTSLNPITNERMTASGIVYGELDLLSSLTFRSQYSVDYNNVDANLFWNPFYGDGTTSGGYSYRGLTNLFSQNFANTFTFKKTFGSIHDINVVAGMESVKQRSEGTTVSRTGFISTYSTQPSYGTVESGSGSVTASRMLGFFGRANYDVADKYHLSLSLRRDGTTRFADTSRWGTFYAVGVAWNLDKEKFMDNLGFLSELKLKASYGTQGNQFLPGSFPYLGVYQSGWNLGSASGVIVGSVNNGSLTWEKQKQLDIGLEFGVLNSRITGSFVYFRRTSDALLFSRPLSPSSGINSVNDNVGGVENYGYEIELNSTNIRKKDFEWRTTLNVTRLTNKITIPAPGTTQEKGTSWYDWFMQEYAGVDAADGLPMWYMDDANGKKITTKDYNLATRYHVGNRLPDYTGGITNFLKYKNFDLTVLASFAIGGKFYDGDYAGLMGAFNSSTALGSNASTDILNRWQSPSNPGDGQTPKLTTASINATAFSTRFLYDLSYMRVRNITLGYKFPEGMLKPVFLSNARVFVDLQNAFTFFGGPKGSDPEAGGINAQSGSNNTTSNKVIAIGINIGL
jgi:TonB-linked SusC/RagA family outer membrane protein